ncbi:cytochrome c [Cellulophaga baltica]|uniref:c-type cytochrome n=1 Tax=Cellulophaga TaxID=104264 RepID=UPI001C074CF1|nr:MULTISPECIES: cytochrome c [Cellulophaga]MBU2997202.1 cytochrome c [Cellulophaga baltica]MDO6768600.1 cytochrome c [Cellulophaga sp. 1_MG-2023]
MKSFIKVIAIVLVLVTFSSCFNKNDRNYQYMPNMYKSVGYETYQKVEFLPSGVEAGLPVENTISRGHMPYKFANTLEDKELARVQASPLDSLKSEENLAVGAELYTIYCAICHGNKGDGNGTLVSREKILGVPNYSDAGRNITVGSTHHTIYYGLNSMGSYANQLNDKERWQVAEYVIKLKQDLIK